MKYQFQLKIYMTSFIYFTNLATDTKIGETDYFIKTINFKASQEVLRQIS